MRHLLLFSLILLAACGRAPSYQHIPEPNDLRTIEFPLFKMKVTGGWEKYETTDSTGFIIRGKDSIVYAVGQNVQPLTEKTNDTVQLYDVDDLNGLTAIFTIPVKGKTGVVAVSVALSSGCNLLMYTDSSGRIDDVLKLYSSIQVSGQSDDVITANITRESFTGGRSGGYYDGQKLFQANCATCHNVIKDATGPSLKSVTSRRSAEWIYHFLADPKFKLDREGRELFLMWNKTACTKFPQLSRSQVEAIVAYVKDDRIFYCY